MIIKEIDKSDLMHRKNITQLQVHTLCVDKNFRGQGVGTAFIDFAKDKAKELGLTTLKVVALAENKEARRFYRKNGFYDFETVHEMKL